MLKLKYILFWITLALLLVLTGASASAQNDTVFAGESSFIKVNPEQGVSYSWELFNDVTGLNLALIPGNCPPTSAFFTGGMMVGDSVNVTWLVPGIYYYKTTAIDACPTNNIAIGMITVLESLPTAVIEPPSVICEGDDGTLVIDLDGDAPFSIVLHDETNDVYTTYNNITDNPYIITVNPTVTTTYTITQVTDIDGTVNTTPSNTVTLIVNPRPTNGTIYQYTP